jgi:hypothetical protein
MELKDLRIVRDDNGTTGPFPAINLLQYMHHLNMQP